MLFRRRRASSISERIRLMLWPRKNWRRSIRYTLLRLKRLPSSPYRIAVGSAAGIFAICTPFLGGQLIMAAIMAWILRGSILASFLISFVGNPITYPIIWFATYNLGAVLLGNTASLRLVDLQGRIAAVGDAIANGSPHAAVLAVESLWPVVKPMAVGALPIGAVAAGAAYISVYRLVSVSRAAHQRRKRNLHTAPVAQRRATS